MSKIEQMFDYKGKTTKVIGDVKAQTYREIYNHISDKQKTKKAQIKTKSKCWI